MIALILLAALLVPVNGLADCTRTNGIQDCVFQLRCQDNSDLERGFLFQRKDSAGNNYSSLAPLAEVNTCSYVDTVSGDPGNVTYTYRAFAVLDDGSLLGPSNEASITSPAIKKNRGKGKGKQR